MDLMKWARGLRLHLPLKDFVILVKLFILICKNGVIINNIHLIRHKCK